jgi:hypothetical protein
VCFAPRGGLLLPVIIGSIDDCRPRDDGHFELLCSCSRRKAKEYDRKTQERDLSPIGHASGRTIKQKGSLAQ